MAGVRTHALVGTGAAVFTLVSAYGFQALPGINQGAVDPSRVAELLPLAVLETLVHLFASLVLRPLSLYLPRYSADQVISLTYEDGREVLQTAAEMGLAVSVLRTARSISGSGREVHLELKVLGQADLHRAVSNFSEVAGVLGASVVTEPDEE